MNARHSRHRWLASSKRRKPFGQLVRSGRSDKYGQVYVERIGNTGFADADEPIAVFRAQDDLAYIALVGYLNDCRSEPGVPAAQVASVQRQVEAFRAWRSAHPERVRKPGRPLR